MMTQAERHQYITRQLEKRGFVLPVLELIVLDSLWERNVELEVIVASLALVDDLSVERSTYEPYLVAVFECRVGGRRTHHS